MRESGYKCVVLWLDSIEHAEIEAAAKMKLLPVSTWIRLVARAAAHPGGGAK